MTKKQSQKKVLVYKKALVYARVSSDRQKNEGHGLDSQVHRCEEYAKSKGYEVEKVFRDSFTGGGDFLLRPAMSELMAYMDKRPTENYVVIFDDLKRLARDTVAHIKLRKEFNARDAKVECPNFNFEDTPEGEFIEIILAAQGELERKQNKRQVIQKQKARLEAGYWPFFSPPGYNQVKHPLHGKLLTRVEPQAAIIQEVLEGFASGRFQEQVDVLEFLRRKNFRAPQQTIYLDTVKKMLMRIIYAGYIEYPEWGVARRKGHHDGLISLETYIKIQERLQARVKTFTRRDLNPDFPLRGFLDCMFCKQPLTASWSRGRSGTFPYYRCTAPDCLQQNKSINRDVVESKFLGILKGVKPRQEALDYTKARLVLRWEKKVSELHLVQKVKEDKLEGVRKDIKEYSFAAVRAENEQIRKVYEDRLKELVAEELVLMEKADTAKLKKINFGTAIDMVFDYLKNPYEKWINGDLSDRRLLLKLVFSDRLAYSKVEGFGTAKLSLPLNVFEVVDTPVNDGCGDVLSEEELGFDKKKRPLLITQFRAFSVMKDVLDFLVLLHPHEFIDEVLLTCPHVDVLAERFSISHSAVLHIRAMRIRADVCLRRVAPTFWPRSTDAEAESLWLGHCLSLCDNRCQTSQTCKVQENAACDGHFEPPPVRNLFTQHK
jgi:site-specific DNA recombinase